jgi:hypothetical protein
MLEHGLGHQLLSLLVGMDLVGEIVAWIPLIKIQCSAPAVADVHNLEVVFQSAS